MHGSSAKVGQVLARKGRQLFSIGPEDSVFRAIEVMNERGIGAMLILDNGRLAGILSERDYTRKVILAGRSSKETPAKDIMTQPVVTVTPDTPIDECLRMMTDRRIRHLPVIGETGLEGVVSMGDLVKWTLAEQRETIEHLHRYMTSV